MRDGLTSIDNTHRTHLVGTSHDLLDGVDRSQDVRLVDDRDDLGRLVDESEVGQIQISLVRYTQPSQLRTCLGTELLPGHQIGVMLHLRDHH